jgi:hypothetical protein
LTGDIHILALYPERDRKIFVSKVNRAVVGDRKIVIDAVERQGITGDSTYLAAGIHAPIVGSMIDAG